MSERTYPFEFTHDWFSNNIPVWERVVKGSIPACVLRPKILEIGCYEGRSTVWFLENIPYCHVTSVDTFQGGKDHAEAGVDFSGVLSRFLRNTAHWHNRVDIIKGDSRQTFISRHWECEFSIIYIDGSHLAPDVFTDIAFAWVALNPFGILILDDYGWGNGRPERETPKPAIDAFLKCFEGQYELLEKGYQVIVKKL